jgi:hypothetical protein
MIELSANRSVGLRAIPLVLGCALLQLSLRPAELVFHRPLASVMTLTDSKFDETVAPGCGNCNAELGGTLERAGNRLTLHTTKSTRTDVPEARSFVLVPWGTRTYLVEEERALAFCNAVNVGEEPDGAPMIGKEGFWALQGDADRPLPEALSLPSVPGDWERYFVREKVTSVTGRRAGGNGCFIDLGLDDGVFEGLEFVVQGVPVDPLLFGAPQVDRIAIVRKAYSKRSVIEYRNYTAGIPDGLSVVSGVRFPARGEH